MLQYDCNFDFHHCDCTYFRITWGTHSGAELMRSTSVLLSEGLSCPLCGRDGGIRTHVPAHHRQNDFESFSLRPLRYVSVYASQQGKVFANLRISVRTGAALELPRTRKPAVQSHFWKLRFPKFERISSVCDQRKVSPWVLLVKESSWNVKSKSRQSWREQKQRFRKWLLKL